jgi:hypothetical protein
VPGRFVIASGMPGHWNTHPRLRGRFDEQYPDDLRVIAHDGGPRFSRVAPEVVWVRVTGGDGDVWSGTLLDRSHHLSSHDAGVSIRFTVPETGALPVMVGDRYLEERPNWMVHPCDRCGITELFDPPSDLIRGVFEAEPDAGDVDRFTAICGWCGGSQLVERVRRSPHHVCRRLEELWDHLAALIPPGLKSKARPTLSLSAKCRTGLPGPAR